MTKPNPPDLSRAISHALWHDPGAYGDKPITPGSPQPNLSPDGAGKPERTKATLTDAQQPGFLFPPESLPPGFQFPVPYLQVVNASVLPGLMPWWSQVPFAKWDTSDDLACFDGTDTSGNPAVPLVHAFTTPGWENRGTLPDFGAWMVKAAEDARAFEAEDT